MWSTLHRWFSRSTLIALAIVVAFVCVGLTSPATAPISIDVRPVLLRIDATSGVPGARACGLDIDIKVWTFHLHIGWPGLPLASFAGVGTAGAVETYLN